MTKAKTNWSTAVSTAAIMPVLTVPMKGTVTPIRVVPSSVATTPIATSGSTYPTYIEPAVVGSAAISGHSVEGDSSIPLIRASNPWAMAASKRGKGSAGPPTPGRGVPPIDAAGSGADRGAPASDAAWLNVGRGELVMIGAAGSTAGRGGGAIGGAGSTAERGGGEMGGAGSTAGGGGGETGGAGATGVGLAATVGAAAPQWEQNLAPSAIRWPHCAQNMESLRRKCWKCELARLCAGPANDSTGPAGQRSLQRRGAGVTRARRFLDAQTLVPFRCSFSTRKGADFELTGVPSHGT